jgi:outer membrane protein assembly factor BamB
VFGPRRLPEEASGQLGIGLDGELRIVFEDKVGRVARSGEIRWSVPAPGVNVSIVTPTASPDGTTWAVFRTVGGTMTVEDVLAFTEAMVAGEEQSSSVLVRVGADGQGMTPVLRSGQEEYTSLAVTAEGEVWLATGDGQLMRLDRAGQLLWRQSPRDE